MQIPSKIFGSIEIVAVGLEELIPVGELDDDFDFGIDCLGCTHDQFARNFVHQAQTEFGPGFVALGGDVGIRLVLLKKKSSRMISSKWRAVSSVNVFT